MEETSQLRISILETVRRISVARKLHPMSPEVIRQLHNWLKRDLLGTTGNSEDLNGNIIGINVRIPSDFWVKLSDAEFLASWSGHRFIYHAQSPPLQSVIFVDITIDPLQISDLLKKPNTRETKASHVRLCVQWLRKKGEEELKNLGKHRCLILFREEANLPSFAERSLSRAWAEVSADFPSISRAGAKQKSPQ